MAEEIYKCVFCDEEVSYEDLLFADTFLSQLTDLCFYNDVEWNNLLQMSRPWNKELEHKTEDSTLEGKKYNILISERQIKPLTRRCTGWPFCCKKKNV